MPASSTSRSSPPKTDENTNAKRKFDAREKILDRRKQTETKRKKSPVDSDSKERLAPAEQLDPVLEARRRKFESKDVVKPVPKKIKLNALSSSQENLSISEDNSRKPLTAQNPLREELPNCSDEREMNPAFFQEQGPLAGIPMMQEFQRKRLPSWAEPPEPNEPEELPELPVRIKQEINNDAALTNINDFTQLQNEFAPSSRGEGVGEMEDSALVINFGKFPHLMYLFFYNISNTSVCIKPCE